MPISRPLRLSGTLRRCVNFARWCQEHQAPPAVLAQLIAAVERHKTAWERSTWDSSTSSRYVDQSLRWSQRAESIAQSLGFTLSWPGLWPTLHKDGKECHLPE